MLKLNRTLDRLRPSHPARSRFIGPAEPLTTVTDLANNPGDLTMHLYLPQDLPAKAPLVVVLHGCTQTADGYARGAGWLTLAERYGFAVLCPEQTRANNPNLCFNWFQPADTARGGGEAASIHAMVQRALADHDLDRERVFVTGLSAGGAMTAVMLATYPEVFAAGAVIAGLPYGAANSMPEAFRAMTQPASRSAADWGDKVRDAAPHAGDWPTISIWHGDGDTTVRPEAGDALVSQWLDVHRLRDDPHKAKTTDGRDYLAWRTPDGRSAVELHRIPGMAHGAPLKTGGADGAGTAGPFLLEVGVSSSLEIARSWGIAANRRRQERPDAPASRVPASISRPTRTAATASPATAGTSARAVGDIIENALRAAGLMK